jgi:selenocysteine lyase/cysteine desulfurase
MIAVVGGDVRVPVLDGSERRYVPLDNAASTPPCAAALAAVTEMATWYGSVHRGTGFKSRLSTDAFESARDRVRRFIGADGARNVVLFGRNTTDVLNHLAAVYPFPPGAVVLVSGMEHHSNDLPWRRAARVVHVAVRADGRLDEDDLRRKLREHGRRVALLAVTGASNVTGVVNPVHAWARWVHEVGGRIVVDAAQLAPHRPIDIGPDDDPEHLDVVALSAHKMYAPFGLGAVVAPRAVLADGAPYQPGGGTVETVDLEHVTWTTLPDRGEAGTPNVLGAVALAAAIGAYEAAGWAAIRAHEQRLTRRALELLRGISGLTVYGDAEPDGAADRLGVVPFNVDGMPQALVAAILADEWGVATRSGCFCAHPYVKRLLNLSSRQEADAQRRILAGDRSRSPGMVRASLGVQSTDDDVEVLGEALRAIAAGRFEQGYELDPIDGTWTHPGLDAMRPRRVVA